VSFDDFIADFKERHPVWFNGPAGIVPNAKGRDSGDSWGNGPLVQKSFNLTPILPPNAAILDRQSQAAGDGDDEWDGVEVEAVEFYEDTAT
jgi:hypothetical protein